MEKSILKPVKHVNDNRWGTNLHMMNTIGCLMVCAAVYEEKGDTSATCTKRILGQHAFGNSDTRDPNLTGCTLSIDRGYCSKE